MTGAPIRYHLELYAGSLEGIPFASLEASTPFPSFSVGDWLQPRLLGDPSTVARIGSYRVVDIGHILWNEASPSSIGHKLMLQVEAVDEQRSDQLVDLLTPDANLAI